jgi:predicted patatin/cPLA2 family phospholipase
MTSGTAMTEKASTSSELDRLVAENIKTRASEIKKGISGKIKTGLVVQGGGMRGTYSMAALMALEECGLGGAFDNVFGASAGAINSAYLLAEQAKLAVTVYLDDISNKKFINFIRLHKVVDIDFLVDGVLKAHKALDVRKVMNSFAQLQIVLTDYMTGTPFVVTNRDSKLDLMEAIRATAAMPVLYNKAIQVNGRTYIDGGLTEGIPLKRAIEAGCTDILVVLTRQANYRRHAPNLFLRCVERLFLTKYPKATRKLIFSEPECFNQALEMIENRESVAKNVRMSVVYPSDMTRMVTRTTIDRQKLVPCALMARNDTRRVLGLEPLADNPF